MNILRNWRNYPLVNQPTSQESFMTFRNELDRLADELHQTFFNLKPLQGSQFEALMLSPSLDIVDEENQYKIEVEMPGIDEKDVEVSISNNILSIKAEKSMSRKDEGKQYLLREIGYGAYERHLPLPENVDANNVKASFKKGMLWVVIPKLSKGNHQPKKINIQKA